MKEISTKRQRWIYTRLSVSAWADNADICSKQYAGTGALKTDFTR